jgi:hypothetical protein
VSDLGAKRLEGYGVGLVREIALAERMKQGLTRLYRLDELPHVGDFVTEAGESEREALFVREAEDDLEIELRMPKLSAREVDLEGGNLDPLCQIIEGVSHFVYLAARVSRKRETTQLELEIQAEVDKYVCARLHHPERRAELRRRLFHDADLRVDLDEDERDRYREAGALAEAWCAHLDRLPHDRARIDEQRRFFRAPGASRLHEMRRLRLAA